MTILHVFEWWGILIELFMLVLLGHANERT
jgi:hypothetical protein